MNMDQDGAPGYYGVNRGVFPPIGRFFAPEQGGSENPKAKILIRTRSMPGGRDVLVAFVAG